VEAECGPPATIASNESGRTHIARAFCGPDPAMTEAKAMTIGSVVRARFEIILLHRRTSEGH
jgi:hypothetical protein